MTNSLVKSFISRKRISVKLGFVLLFSLFSLSALAFDHSGKLLLTGGVTQIEGQGGGGLTPWALIGGYGTRDQVGANAHYTKIHLSDYELESYGAMIGLFDRVELSASRQSFNTKKIGASLGIGRGYQLRQDILGIKIKILGDAVLEQASWLPQIAIGVQYKHHKDGAIVKSLGAKDDAGIDYYASATKLVLSQSLLLNATLRATKANQLGILGFGGDKDDSYSLMGEASVAYLLCRTLALGIEYRMKPDNLKVAKEEDWKDIFLAWAPTKNISLTVAYALLGNVATRDNQSAFYSSLQLGF